MSVQDKLAKTGPRKLLALDGGGIRGLITIEILFKIESMLRDACKKPDLVLADYFDYVAGTSTGAIIASCISLGMSMEELRRFYEESGAQMFEKAMLLDRLKYTYEDEPLAKKLRDTIGKLTGDPHASLGHSKIRTLLMMVLRNATTDSPWPISNNPDAKYNCPKDRPGCNLNLPLWKLIRASAAAPVYFPPEAVTINGKVYIFVDGGITMYNNPSFQLFLMCTLEPYRLRWCTGEDKMLLVSVGTGTAAQANANLQADKMNLLYNAKSIPSALMAAALHEQDLLCRTFGRCVAGAEIDREVGTLLEDDKRGFRGPLASKLFRYVRYNADLTREGLDKLGLKGVEPSHVQELDSIAHMQDLQKVGAAVANLDVKPEHLEGFGL
jgi:patatin-like phospholipase/acyl hydrolase